MVKSSRTRNRKRLSKRDYQRLNKYNTKCYKESQGLLSTNIPIWDHCAICKLYLGTTDEICDKTEVNCCYDCIFNSYCEKCCFTWIHDNGNRIFRTCGIGFMKQLLHRRYRGGRYSSINNEKMDVLRIRFKNDMKYGIHPNTMRGKIVIEDDILS
jgi:hypothetical protein